MTPSMKALSDQINQGDEHDNSVLLEAIECLQEREAEQARKEEKNDRLRAYRNEEFICGMDGDHHYEIEEND